MKSSLIMLVAVSAVVLLGGTAFGSVVTLEGTTTGSFLPSVTGMTFTGQNFTWTTGSDGNATVNLGTLTWTSTYLNAINDGFTLHITFSEPNTTPVSKAYTADLNAFWNGFNGICDVWFDDVNKTHVTYTTDGGSGSFDLGIAGTLSNGYYNEGFVPHRWFGIGHNGSVQLTGTITGATFTAAVPEPASLALLALGGLATLLRRRKA